MRAEWRAECPPEADIAGLFDARLSEPRASQVKAHLETCKLCAAEMNALAEFTAAAPDPAEQADVDAVVADLKRRRRTETALPAWRRWLARPALPRLAGAVALVALAAAVTLQVRTSRTDDVEGYQATGTMRSGAVPEVQPRGDLSEAPREIRWTPVPGAAAYEVRLTEVDGTELWAARTSATRMEIPGKVRSALLPRKTVMIRVWALDASQRQASQPDVSRIRVMPGGEK